MPKAIVPDGYKRCSRGEQCVHPDGPILPINQFGKWKYGRDGLKPQCKACSKDDAEKYRNANRDTLRRKGREYYQQHRDHFRENSRRWALEHPERMRVISQRSVRKHRIKRREMTRQWSKANPSKVREQERRRRARKLGACGSHTADDVRAQYESQRGLCWWCGKPVGKRFHIDHRIPLSRGGSDAPDNLCISCPSCNLSKNDKMPWEWNGRLL